MKRVWGIILASFLALYSVQGFAQALPAATVSVSPSRAQCGEAVTVTGTAEVDELVSIKVTDSDGNIVFFGTARAGSDGRFQCTFKVPEMNPGTLTVTAGNGNNVAKAQVEIYIQRYFIVTFDKNGGSTNANPAKITVKEGALIGSKPTAPTRAGYTFTGWYKEKQCSNTWNFGTDRVTGDLTLYAGWKLIPATAMPVTPSTAPTASITPAASSTPASSPTAASTGRWPTTAAPGQTPTAECGHTQGATSGAALGTQATISPGESGSPLAHSTEASKASGGLAAMLPWIALLIILAIVAVLVLLRKAMGRGARKGRNVGARPRPRSRRRQ